MNLRVSIYIPFLAPLEELRPMLHDISQVLVNYGFENDIENEQAQVNSIIIIKDYDVEPEDTTQFLDEELFDAKMAIMPIRTGEDNE